MQMFIDNKLGLADSTERTSDQEFTVKWLFKLCKNERAIS